MTKNITIDCDTAPFIPDGWKVEEHTKGGTITFDASKIELYLSKKQKGGYIEGNDLRKELKGKNALNANVLDFLLKNTQLIPGEWKGKYVFFWGTIYRHSVGRLCVRCLYWGGGAWRWGRYWLDGGFHSDGPAALLASSTSLSEPDTSSETLPFELEINGITYVRK